MNIDVRENVFKNDSLPPSVVNVIAAEKKEALDRRPDPFKSKTAVGVEKALRKALNTRDNRFRTPDSQLPDDKLEEQLSTLTSGILRSQECDAPVTVRVMEYGSEGSVELRQKSLDTWATGTGDSSKIVSLKNAQGDHYNVFPCVAKGLYVVARTNSTHQRPLRDVTIVSDKALRQMLNNITYSHDFDKTSFSA